MRRGRLAGRGDDSDVVMLVTVDSREPEPHRWARYLPEGWSLERGSLETGDLALAALPDGAVVERKTAGDLVSGSRR